MPLSLRRRFQSLSRVRSKPNFSTIKSVCTVHRDLKPANVLIAEGEDAVKSLRVKLADFGVSTLLVGQDSSTGQKPPPRVPSAVASRPAAPSHFLPPEEDPEAAWDGETVTPQGSARDGAAAAELAVAETGDGQQLTQTGALIGTPMYMAPELSEGSHHALPPSDVFSLGMIAYELYSGEIPFARPPVWARWRGKDAAAPSLANKRPDLPYEIVKLIDSCLQLDPALRPTAAVITTTLRGHVDPQFTILS